MFNKHLYMYVCSEDVGKSTIYPSYHLQNFEYDILIFSCIFIQSSSSKLQIYELLMTSRYKCTFSPENTLPTENSTLESIFRGEILLQRLFYRLNLQFKVIFPDETHIQYHFPGRLFHIRNSLRKSDTATSQTTDY